MTTPLPTCYRFEFTDPQGIVHAFYVPASSESQAARIVDNADYSGPFHPVQLDPVRMDSNVPAHWVGKLLGNPKPAVLSCGHVELVKGVKGTTVDFDSACQYAAELQRQLAKALSDAATN